MGTEHLIPYGTIQLHPSPCNTLHYFDQLKNCTHSHPLPLPNHITPHMDPARFISDPSPPHKWNQSLPLVPSHITPHMQGSSGMSLRSQRRTDCGFWCVQLAKIGKTRQISVKIACPRWVDAPILCVLFWPVTHCHMSCTTLLTWKPTGPQPRPPPLHWTPRWTPPGCSC